MPKHHSKLEDFAIHLVAVLFTLSSLSAVFLGLSVLESQDIGFKIAKPAYASFTLWSWKQTSWVAATTATYNINWNTTGGWTDYNSATGVTFGGTGLTINDGGSLVSSVYNVGSRRELIFLPNTAGFPTMFARDGNTVEEVNAAPWQSVGSWCTISKSYYQYKIENSSGVPLNIDDITIYGQFYWIYGFVKDASNASPLTGASLNYGSGTETTTDSGYYDIEIPLGVSNVSITASKSGYSSQTKTIPIPQDFCVSDSVSSNFGLTPTPPSSPSPSIPPASTPTTSSTPTTQTVQQGPPVTLSTFQQVKLPTLFTATGSTTTDLTKVTDPTNVSNFTLDILGSNKIVFKEPVNLSGQNTVDYLKTLDQYIKIGTSGTVELNSTILTILNKPATITMYKLNYVSTPEILINGKPDTSGLLSNVSFDKQTGILSFDVTHFTVFQAVPKLELKIPAGGIREANSAIRGGISDPKAIITGTFNGVKLAPITPNKDNGEFIITKVLFKNGDNLLKLEAKSDWGSVLPLQTTIKFNSNSPTSPASKPLISSNRNVILTILFVALGFLLLFSYLIYRKKHKQL